jgi:ATP-binding cassette subfamily B protein
VNYNEISTTQIREKYSIVFQDFQIYAVTIAENVLMRRVETKEDEELVWEALRKVGLEQKIKKFKNNIYTLVTREFDRDGISFSGGERQRLAIARVFASNKDIYILDEPTSALDPLAEERINKLIIDSAGDKTMLIIAHRLSTVVDADIIYLVREGNILEKGTHKQLMELNGRYAYMFNVQKELYEVKK